MRYNVGFNQRELVQYNKGKPPKKKLTVIDAIILQQLYRISKWENVETIEREDGVYFWAAYGKIIDELPTLGITTTNGMAKRISANLIKPGLLQRHIQWNDNSKTFWKLTPKGLKIGTPGQRGETYRTNGKDTPGQKGETPPDERENNYPTIDKQTKDERENRALDFLQLNHPSRYEEYLMDNKKQIKNWEKFTADFNDTVDDEKRDYDVSLFFRLAKYTRNWIENQNKYSAKEENEAKPVYHRRIS
mgnify:CR=1